MNLPFFIARRYLLSKRKKNFINVISIISAVAVTIITAAIIIVLSIFNGLEELLHTLNNSFDPEIKIEAVLGKSFLSSPQLINKIKGVKGVEIITEVIEDYAYVRYRDANQLITLKGVSDNFIDQNRIPKENIVEGELKLRKGDVNYALVGRGIKYALTIAIGEDLYPLQVYYIKNVKATSLDPSSLYSKKNILPAGVFSIIQNFDDNYVIVPLNFAQELLNYGDKRTALEIKTVSGVNIYAVEAEIQKIIGNDFKVLNNEEQHEDIYRVLKLEKLVASLSAVLLLIIGSINIYFNLMMLALDKKKDISILASLGASEPLLKKIFIAEGLLIAGIGTLSGLALAAIIIFLQQKFGFVSMGMASAVMEGYPVKMVLSDFIYVLFLMAVITVIISFRPAVLASRFASVRNL
ncbi:MAG: FtsX-like permease family protein [Chryseolinea sp.]